MSPMYGYRIVFLLKGLNLTMYTTVKLAIVVIELPLPAPIELSHPGVSIKFDSIIRFLYLLIA